MTATTCLTCNQPLPNARGKRVCWDCREPIRRHDRWYIGADGRLHHNDCAQPMGAPVAPSPTMELLKEHEQ